MESDVATLLQHYGDSLRADGLAIRTIENYEYALRGFVRIWGSAR